MNRDRLITLCAIGASALASLGCASRTVVHERPVVVAEKSQPVIVQSETMPAPREEQPGRPPRSGDTWVSGHWEKADGGWRWESGHWEERH